MAQEKNIDHEILNYLGRLSENKKKAVLSLVKTFAEETVSLWDMMPDEVRKGVELSIEQSKKGIGRSNDEVMKKYEKWLRK